MTGKPSPGAVKVAKVYTAYLVPGSDVHVKATQSWANLIDAEAVAPEVRRVAEPLVVALRRLRGDLHIELCEDATGGGCRASCIAAQAALAAYREEQGR